MVFGRIGSIYFRQFSVFRPNLQTVYFVGLDSRAGDKNLDLLVPQKAI